MLEDHNEPPAQAVKTDPAWINFFPDPVKGAFGKRRAVVAYGPRGVGASRHAHSRARMLAGIADAVGRRLRK